MYDDRNKIIK